jgi:predicted enzyme related to lactoylglutathione lyase
MPTTEAPPSFLPYFGHEDTAALLGDIEGLGGTVLNGPVRMPQGTIAVLRDPQGAVFAVWSGEYEE